MLLGAMGFAGSFYTLSFSFPPFSISINWSDFLPLLAGMAFGGRYGFIAATLGFGAFYPFVLWSSDGWACMVTSLLLIWWPTLNGFFMSSRRGRPAPWNRPYPVYALSILVFNGITYALFPVAMRFNPPFWNPGAERSMPAAALDGITVKGIVVLCLCAIFVDFLLKLPLIRRMLGLDTKRESRLNGRVALVALGGSLAIWYLFLVLEKALLFPVPGPDLAQFRNSLESIALLTCLSAGLFIGSALVSYQEMRLEAEDSLSIGEERLKLAVSAADIGIWDWHIAEDLLLWDEGMHRIYGTAKAGFRGKVAAWREVIHPDDIRLFDEDMQTALRGERMFSPVFRILRPDGEVRSIKAHSHIIRDRTGKALRMIGVNLDITDRILAEEQIRKSLEEKILLLRELHHRTKNNMAVISALLNMQAEETRDDRLCAAYAEMQARIDSMSLVHQKLYEARDLSRINLKAYVSDLMGLLSTSFRVSAVKLSVEREMEDVSVSIDVAIPCGLILAELFMNSFKHAFPSDRSGEITCRLQKLTDGEILLSVADNGVGLPPGFDPAKDGRMGLQTIRSLGEQQLNGKVQFESHDGLTCELRFRGDSRLSRV